MAISEAQRPESFEMEWLIEDTSATVSRRRRRKPSGGPSPTTRSLQDDSAPLADHDAFHRKRAAFPSRSLAWRHLLMCITSRSGSAGIPGSRGEVFWILRGVLLKVRSGHYVRPVALPGGAQSG